MTQPSVSRDEIKKLAQMSALAVTDQELDYFTHELQNILTYAASLADAAQAAHHTTPLPHTINIMRTDTAIPSITQQLIMMAPQHEQNHIIVPAIITHDKE